MVNPSEYIKSNKLKWDRRAETYDNKRFDYFRYMQRQAIKQIDFQENTDFLDIGCGTGWAVRYVAGLLGGHGHFVGIDISDRMIEKARENSCGSGKMEFIIADAEELPFETACFDNIICTNSFHHYLNPGRVMSEIFRVLRPEGRIHILDVTSDDFFIRWINKIVGKKEEAHVNFYSTKDYKRMFLSGGLKHVISKRLMYPLKLHIAEK